MVIRSPMPPCADGVLIRMRQVFMRAEYSFSFSFSFQDFLYPVVFVSDERHTDFLDYCLIVLAFNLISDGLRDAFDPRSGR